jgi:hypothetical protein
MTDADDTALIATIRQLLDELDPVPPEVLAAARGSYVWRTVDAELAELVADSTSNAHAGVRSGDGPRLITFETERLTVEVEVGQMGEQRRLVGQLVPPAHGTVEVRSPSRSWAVEADALGRFTVSGVPPGPVSLLCRLAAAPERPIVTSWLTI